MASRKRRKAVSVAAQRRAYDRATRKARVAERIFVRAVVTLQRSIVLTYQSRLKGVVKRLSLDGGVKADAKPGAKEVNAAEKLLRARIAPRLQVAYGRMAKSVDDASKEYAEVIGIGSADLSKGVREQIEKRRDESIKLVEDANRDYAKQVRDVFGDPANTGLRVEELQAKLVDRGMVSESRAELIARDQTTKLLGGLNEARQREAGITRYTWCTSRDERVRPEHEERDGAVFSWDEPPEDGHPGEPVLCRCSASPILDD